MLILKQSLKKFIETIWLLGKHQRMQVTFQFSYTRIYTERKTETEDTTRKI